MSATILETNHRETITANPTTWKIDGTRSRASFSVANRFMLLMNVNVTGTFSDISGTFEFDEDRIEHARAEITIGSASIDSRMSKRDIHLKSTDFFDVEYFPRMRFISTAVRAVDRARGDFQVRGMLTIRNVSHPVTLDVQLAGAGAHAQERRLTLTGTATVDRREFGMGLSKPPLSIPADEVKLTVTLEATAV